ncbi:unnamed protein product [Orchesella dallaii]|uniref:Uncharacterized protein n=1 Tax=Orchesella dallaii TaxID=48710 RepID=A0ABP1QL19_9HEXA
MERETRVKLENYFHKWVHNETVVIAKEIFNKTSISSGNEISRSGFKTRTEIIRSVIVIIFFANSILISCSKAPNTIIITIKNRAKAGCSSECASSSPSVTLIVVVIFILDEVERRESETFSLK